MPGYIRVPRARHATRADLTCLVAVIRVGCRPPQHLAPAISAEVLRNTCRRVMGQCAKRVPIGDRLSPGGILRYAVTVSAAAVCVSALGP